MIERILGRLLRGVRADERHLAWNDPRLSTAPASIVLSSPAFADGGAMPDRCAGRGGQSLSPALDWSNVPADTVELVLILQDVDAPTPRPVVHLIALAIAPERSGVPEGSLVPVNGRAIRFGRGAFGRIGYAGPGPVRGHGPHRYVFQIFALAQCLALPGAPNLATLIAAMAGHVVARGRLIGTYERT